MDDYLKIVQPKIDARRQVNDAQILTVAVLSAQYYYGNQHTTYQYMRQHHGMAKIDKSNRPATRSKPEDSAAMRFIKKYYRKRIETSFSEITAHFPAKIHAVTPQGFLLKIILFIFAFTFNKTLSAT